MDEKNEILDISFVTTPFSKNGNKPTTEIGSRKPLSSISQSQAQAIRSFPPPYGSKVPLVSSVTVTAADTPKTLRQLEAYNAELESLTNSPATSAAIAAPTPITAWGMSRYVTQKEETPLLYENNNSEQQQRHQLVTLSEQMSEEEEEVEDVIVEEIQIPIESKADVKSPLYLNGGISSTEWTETQDHPIEASSMIHRSSDDKSNEQHIDRPPPRRTVDDLLSQSNEFVMKDHSSSIVHETVTVEQKDEIDVVESEDAQVLIGTEALDEIESLKKSGMLIQGMIHIIPSAPLLSIQQTLPSLEEDDNSYNVKSQMNQSHVVTNDQGSGGDGGRLLIDDLTTTRADFTTIQGLTRGPAQTLHIEENEEKRYLDLVNDKMIDKSHQQLDEEKDKGVESSIQEGHFVFSKTDAASPVNVFTESAVATMVDTSISSTSMSKMAMAELDFHSSENDERFSSSSSSSSSSLVSNLLLHNDGTSSTKSNTYDKEFSDNKTSYKTSDKYIITSSTNRQQTTPVIESTKSYQLTMSTHSEKTMSLPTQPVSLQIPASLSSLTFPIAADMSLTNPATITSWRHTPTGSLPYQQQQSTNSSGVTMSSSTFPSSSLDPFVVDVPLRNAGNQAIHLKLAFSISTLTLNTSSNEKFSCNLASDTYISALPQSLTLEPSSIGRTRITLSATSLISSLTSSSMYQDFFQQKQDDSSLKDAVLTLRLDLDAADGKDKPLTVPIRILITFRQGLRQVITKTEEIKNSQTTPSSFPSSSSSSSSITVASHPILETSSVHHLSSMTSTDQRQHTEKITRASPSLHSSTESSSSSLIFKVDTLPSITTTAARPASATDFAMLPDLRGGGGGRLQAIGGMGTTQSTSVGGVFNAARPETTRPASAPPVNANHSRREDTLNLNLKQVGPLAMASTLTSSVSNVVHNPLALLPRVPSPQTSSSTVQNMQTPQVVSNTHTSHFSSKSVLASMTTTSTTASISTTSPSIGQGNVESKITKVIVNTPSQLMHTPTVEQTQSVEETVISPDNKRRTATRLLSGTISSSTSSQFTRKSTRIPLSPQPAPKVSSVPIAASIAPVVAFTARTSISTSTSSDQIRSSPVATSTTPVKKSAFSARNIISSASTITSSAEKSLSVSEGTSNGFTTSSRISTNDEVNEKLENNTSAPTPIHVAFKLPMSMPMNRDKRGGMFAVAAAAAAASTAASTSTSTTIVHTQHSVRSSSASATTRPSLSTSPAEKKKAIGQRASSIGASEKQRDDKMIQTATEFLQPSAESSSSLSSSSIPSSSSSSSSSSAPINSGFDKKRRRKTLSTKSAKEEKEAHLPSIPSVDNVFNEEITATNVKSRLTTIPQSSVAFSPMAVSRIQAGNVVSGSSTIPSTSSSSSLSSFSSSSKTVIAQQGRRQDRRSTATSTSSLRVRPLPYLRSSSAAATKRAVLMRDAATSPIPSNVTSPLNPTLPSSQQQIEHHPQQQQEQQQQEQQQEQQSSNDTREIAPSTMFSGFATGKQNFDPIGVVSTAAKSRSRVFVDSVSSPSYLVAVSPPHHSHSKRPPLYKLASENSTLKSPSAITAEAVATSVLSPASSTAISLGGDLTQYSFIVPTDDDIHEGIFQNGTGKGVMQTVSSLSQHSFPKLSPASASFPPSLGQSKKRRTNLLGEPWGWTNSTNSKKTNVKSSQQHKSQQVEQKGHVTDATSGASNFQHGFVWEMNVPPVNEPSSMSPVTSLNINGEMKWDVQRQGFETMMPLTTRDDEENSNRPVRTRIDLFGAQVPSHSQIQQEPPQEHQHQQLEYRSEVFSAFESAMDMNETIPNDVTGDINVEVNHHNDQQEDEQEEEEEEEEEEKVIIGSSKEIQQEKQQDRSTSLLFAPVFADLIDANEAEQVVDKEFFEQEKHNDTSKQSSSTLINQGNDCSVLASSLAVTVCASEMASSSPNQFNSSAFDKTLPIQPVTDCVEITCRSDQTAIWSQQIQNQSHQSTPTYDMKSSSTSNTLTPLISESHNEEQRLRDSQLKRALPAQAPSQPASLQGHTPRLILSQQQNQYLPSFNETHKVNQQEESLQMAALEAPLQSDTPQSSFTPLLHSSFGFNDTGAGSRLMITSPLTPSFSSSPSLSSSTSQSTWFVMVDSLTLQLPLPSPFITGPDGTNLSTSIHIKNGSSNNLFIKVFGPDNAFPLTLSCEQDSQFEDESVSEALNGNKAPSSDMSSSDQSSTKCKTSSLLWQPLTLLSSLSMSSNNTNSNMSAEYVTEIPSRSLEQVNIRFSLPTTGRRVDMKGWIYNEEKHSATASLHVVEASKPSFKTVLNLQPIKITVSEGIWRRQGYKYDAATESLYSTGDVVLSSTDNTLNLFSSVKPRNLNIPSTAAPLPFMSPMISSMPTGGHGPRLPLGIGLSSVLQSPPRPVLSSSHLISSSPSSPKHERVQSSRLIKTRQQEENDDNASSSMIVSSLPYLSNTVNDYPIPVLTTLHGVSTQASQVSTQHHSIRAIQRSAQKASDISMSRNKRTHSLTEQFDEQRVDPLNQFSSVAPLVINENSGPVSNLSSSSSYSWVQYDQNETAMHNSQPYLHLPPAPTLADKPKARTGLGPFASPPGVNTIAPHVSSSTSNVLSSTSSMSRASAQSSQTISSPGVRFPMRTLLFPADSNIIKVELSNTSQEPLRVRARLTCPGMDMQSSSSSSSSVSTTTPFFHLKKNHMEFDLMPRRYVLIPVTFKTPIEGAEYGFDDKSSHACTLIVEATTLDTSEQINNRLTLKSKVLLVKE